MDTGLGVKSLILRGNRCLVLINLKGGCDLPGGRLEANETSQEGLEREILEETAIKKVVITNVSAPWYFQKTPSCLIHGNTFLCHYVTGEVTVSPEHIGYMWTPLNKIAGLDIYKKYALDRLTPHYKKQSLKWRKSDGALGSS